MRCIKLEVTEFTTPALGPAGFIRDADGAYRHEKKRLSFREELKGIIMCTPISQGFTIQDVRHAMTIMEALEHADEPGDLLLEEADWSYLCRVIDAARFTMPNRGVLLMGDAVKGASVVKPGKTER